MDKALPGTRARQLPAALDTIDRSILETAGNVVPALFFALVLVSKVVTLVRGLPLVQGDWVSPSFLALAVQQLLTIVFFGFVVVLFVLRRPPAGRRSSRLGGAVALAGTFIYNVPVGARVVEDNLTLLVASSALIAAGLIWSLASLAFLGRCFGVFPEARGLVTRGPYRWLRHPLYLGELTSSLGTIVATASLPLFGVLVVQAGLQYWRTRLEERALIDAFPEYAAYRERTWGLFPGIR